MLNDSISRYDTSADHFNAFTTNKLKDPEEVLRSMAAHSKDTIESSQEKMEAEIINRLQVNAGDMGQNKLPIIARAGKFVFMAIAIPSYMIIYSLPKWVATQLIPNTCQYFSNALKQCFRPVQEVAMQLFRQIVQLTKVLRREKGRVFKTLSHFKKLFVVLKHPFKKMKALWQNLKQKVGEKRSALRELLETTRQKIRTRLKNAAETVRNKTKRTIYGRLSENEPLAPWRQAIIRFVHKIHRTYKYVTSLPARAVTFIKHQAHTLYQTYVFPHVDRTAKFIQRVAKRVNKTREAVVGACKRIANRNIEKAKRAYQRTQQAVLSAAKQLIRFTGLPTFVNAIASTFGSFVQKANKVKQGVVKLRQNIGKAIKSLTSKVKLPLPSLSQFIPSFAFPVLSPWFEKPIQWASSFRARLKKIRKALQRKVSSVAKTSDKKWNPLPFLARIKAKFGRKTRRAIYYTRLTGAWTRILTGFWMASVRNLCESCVEHLTWKDIVYFIRKAVRSFVRFVGSFAERRRIYRAKSSYNQ